MRIVIDIPDFRMVAGPSWGLIESLLCSTHDGDLEAQNLTRIGRVDGGHAYREPGEYRITYQGHEGKVTTER